MRAKSLLLVLSLFFCLFLFSGCSGPQGTPSTKPPPASSAPENKSIMVARETSYRRKRLLNRTEEITFWALFNLFKKHFPNQYFINLQVSLAEIVTWNPKSIAAKNITISKRVDFCITDKEFQPIAVIEVHGSGHYLSKQATIRTEVKRIICSRAGIPFVVIDDADKKKVAEKLEKELLPILFKTSESNR